MTESSDQTHEAGMQADHDNGPEEANVPFDDVSKQYGISMPDAITDMLDGIIDADSMLGMILDTRRKDLAAWTGQSIGRILKSRGIKKADLDKKFKVTGKDRLADVIKGRLQPRKSGRKSKPLDIELISDLSWILDVPPSVLLGDIDEEEFRIIEKLRAMSDGDRAAVLQIINSLSNGNKSQ